MAEDLAGRAALLAHIALTGRYNLKGGPPYAGAHVEITVYEDEHGTGAQFMTEGSDGTILGDLDSESFGLPKRNTPPGSCHSPFLNGGSLFGLLNRPPN